MSSRPLVDAAPFARRLRKRRAGAPSSKGGAPSSRVGAPSSRVSAPSSRVGDPCPTEDDDNALPVARTDEDARFALPGGGGVHVALLFDGNSVDGVRALAELSRSALVGWCALLNPVAIDIGRATDVRAWFGLQSQPALVAIWDGAVLAIEYDFDPRALQSLAAAAVKRYRQLEPDE